MQLAPTTMGILLLLLTNVLGYNWKERKRHHFQLTKPLQSRSLMDIEYFSNGLKNERDFEEILDNILIVRTVGSEGHRFVQQYIISYMKSLGWDVEQNSFSSPTPKGPTNFTNIIATHGINSPRRLVFACHYDSKMTPKGFLGATDSAVPCAQMINLAVTLKRDLDDRKARKQDSDLTLQMIFFDGEEAFVQWDKKDSIYGSRDLARRWKDEAVTFENIPGNFLDRIDVFILLDLIGETNPSFYNFFKDTTDWYETMAAIEFQLNDLKAFGSNHRRMFTNFRGPSGIEDDHIPFLRKGVPILHLIPYPFPDVWHKSGDNKNAVDLKTVEKMNMILRVFVAEYLGLQ